MPAITNHPAFVQPQDSTQRIWRYMDFAKLSAMLDSKSLYFARIDQLSDAFEGSLSKAEYEHWKTVAAEGEANGLIPSDWKGRYFDILLMNARRSRKAIYVNCWHANQSESEAMWRLYSPSGYGVAVRSTYRRLVESLPEKVHNGCFVGLVQYTDHHTEQMPSGNAFYPVLHKRRAFEHEREVRALVWIADPGFAVDKDQATNPAGVSIPVVLDQLIEAIHICPTAPSWFAAAVKGVVRQYGIDIPTVDSDLTRGAYY